MGAPKSGSLGKPKYAFTSKSTPTEELTGELFSKLSKANQLLANLAEQLTGSCFISDYQGNKYVSSESIDALVKYYYPD